MNKKKYWGKIRPSFLSISFASMLLSLSSLFFAASNLSAAQLPKSNNDIDLKTIRSVLPEIANDPIKDKTTVHFEDKDTSGDAEIYIGKDKSEQIVGYAVRTVSHKGYNGDIEFLVGVLPDKSIRKIHVLKQQETSGLGAKVESDEFLNQFKGKSLNNYKFKVKDDGGDIDAITVATITSRAAGEAITDALKAVETLDKSGGKIK